MHRYFASRQPSLQNEYTGLFAGDNLLFIVAEGLYYPLAEMADFFPALHHLTTSSWQFSNFYNPLWGVSTSDGEYVALTGLLPKRGVWSFSRSAENYLPFTLGRQFQALGYEQVLAYHNHTYTCLLYTSLGMIGKCSTYCSMSMILIPRSRCALTARDLFRLINILI